jgi:hypothetical protein
VIIKIDKATETSLRQLRESVKEQTGVTPQSVSLMVQVILQWSLEGLKGPALRELAPRMLTLSQQRKAIIGEMLALKEQLNPSQIKEMMKTLEKLKRNASINEAPSPIIST